ncbi:hypothetical protein GGP41_000410 [Bipolaris sorokiniana]|uniref:Uncharacterized protein n=1 Tax=Cochliobolus sativus TaxID=45130 RepID=A0A8H5ZMT8_COCSA|nr:hypothetical protein GGP41_000410 [Bipolaris sorokiniana]
MFDSWKNQGDDWLPRHGLGLFLATSSLPTVDLSYQVYRASGFNESSDFYNFSNIRYRAPPIKELIVKLPQLPAKSRSSINSDDMSQCILYLMVMKTPVNIPRIYP